MMCLYVCVCWLTIVGVAVNSVVFRFMNLSFRYCALILFYVYVVFAALGGFLVVVLWVGWLFVYGGDLVFRLDCDTVVSACGLCDFGWVLASGCLLVVDSDFSGLVWRSGGLYILVFRCLVIFGLLFACWVVYVTW